PPHPNQLQHRLSGMPTRRAGRRTGLQARHEAGTTTCWPAVRPVPVTWTRPASSSKRPRVTGTRRWPLDETTSTAEPPPARARSAVTGTTRMLATVAVVMASWTGAWSRSPVPADGVIWMWTVGEPPELPAVATVPTEVTVPGTVRLSGMVIVTGSP